MGCRQTVPGEGAAAILTPLMGNKKVKGCCLARRATASKFSIQTSSRRQGNRRSKSTPNPADLGWAGGNLRPNRSPISVNNPNWRGKPVSDNSATARVSRG